jgi:Zn-dependent protease
MMNSEHLVGSASGEFVEWLGKLLSIMFSLNLLLFVFNLLPLPPLDGSSLPLFFLSESAAESYSAIISNPTFNLFGLLIAWRVFPYLFEPIRVVAMQAIYFGAS